MAKEVAAGFSLSSSDPVSSYAACSPAAPSLTVCIKQLPQRALPSFPCLKVQFGWHAVPY